MDAILNNMTDLAMTQATAPHLGKLAGSAASIDKTSSDFEGMFMSQMLQPMFDTIKVDPVFGGGNGEQVMRSFMVQEYGKIAAKGSHLGIADAVKREMIKAQSTTQGSGGTNAVIQ